MHPRTIALLSFSALCVSAFTMPAAAGPCTEQIAELGRKLSQSPALGPVTTGTLSGSGPGSIAAPAAQPGTPSASGTSADNRVGGTAGTKEINAAVGQIATSPDDVRRQQQGLPTAAAVAAAGPPKSIETTPGQSAAAAPDDRMSQAKMELERARMLDQKDDSACRGAVDRTRQLAG